MTDKEIIYSAPIQLDLINIANQLAIENDYDDLRIGLVLMKRLCRLLLDFIEKMVNENDWSR